MPGHRRPTSRPALAVAAAVGAVAAAAVTLVLVPGDGSPGQPATAQISFLPEPTPAPARSTQLAPPADIELRATVIVEGNASIGDDAAPGLWMSAGGPACRWSRDAGTSWSFDTGGHPTSPITISLRQGTRFETHSCAPWKKVG